MNMSYCRMQNTNGDLGQCMDDLLQYVSCNAVEDGGALSDDELAAATSILQKVAQLAHAMQEAWGDDWQDEDAIDDAMRSNHATIKELLKEGEKE